jgi:hypothetical protein
MSKTQPSNADAPTSPDSGGSPPVPGSGFVIAPTDRLFRIKSPCPYCGGEITVSANAWEQDDDGSWYATDLDVNCSNEPSIDSPKWPAWDAEHGRNDYSEAWHQLHERIVRALRSKVCFNIQNAEVSDR